jgi:hypothetical protein
MMDHTMRHRRKQDLQVSFHETLDLIRQYEEKRRLSDDPREKKECERQIADLRQLLEEYREELSELEEIAKPQTELWPSVIPDERYYPLPGRERDLDQLLKAFQDPQGPSTIVFDGLGGIGKTAMAVELARRALRQEIFESVIGGSAKQEILAGGEIIRVRFKSVKNSIMPSK